MPVFYDPVGKRHQRMRRFSWLLGAGVTAVVVTFIASVFINPVLPRSYLPRVAVANIRLKPPTLVTNRRQERARRAAAALRRELARTPVVPGRRPAQIRVTPFKRAPSVIRTQPPVKPLAIGFYVNWDDSSYQSLKRNLTAMDWVVPEWLRLQAGENPLANEVDPRALDLIRRTRPTLPILPMIHNSRAGNWEPETLVQQIAKEDGRRRLVGALVQFVAEGRFQGVCVDFEEVPEASQTSLLQFMQELHGTFRQHNWIVAQAVPLDDEQWNYRAYASATDYLMLMAYDEHWADSDAGSVGGQTWFEATLTKRMRQLDGSHTIICIGGYGYDWESEGEATEVTFQEAVLSARDSEARIVFDPVTRNPYFRYEDDAGSKHTVWFLDAVTAFNQLSAARDFGPAGFALWRLGSEDPSLWTVFGNKRTDSPPDGLKEIVYGYDVDFEGMGEILQFAASPKAGARAFSFDAASGLITASEYLSIPSSYVIRRTGYRPGTVALTFDDGPDPEWTPRILDILKQEKVPAAFFIIGENGESNPQLVRRIVAEGHDLGNHSFTHPNLGEIPGRLTRLELTATQRLIESLTGRSSLLFRAPYFGDAEPQTPDEVEPAAIANQLGYIIVGLRVDPDDWALPGADEIVRRSLAGIENPNPDERGQIVLLHDGGGDRSQTVAALPKLIDEVRARGLRFVTVSELAGMTRDQAMPPVARNKDIFARADDLTFFALGMGGWILRWIYLIGIVLGLARLIFIGALALAQRRSAGRRASPPSADTASPLVSVVVPAYNEEKVILQTIASLLASDYPNLEILVVDDGSSDRTSEVVRRQFGDQARVRLFTRENAGKAEALNYGMRQSRGEIIVALDADTIFMPRTIGALAAQFRDPRIGAVAGNAKVGNRLNLVTRWQALEYITAQNLDRRAFASLNCITVVPGAVGAWRRALLDNLGGFTSDTLAEDQDLTLTVRESGYKIGYEEHATAWTEAPDTVRGLARQRFRWSFGTLQCMWKHRRALLRPRYGTLGFIAMPNVWIFQILFPLISPVMDLMFVWTLIASAIERLEHPHEYAITNLNEVVFFYALFLAVDWLAAAFAFLLEKGEQWSLLWWLFLQRFCYRQVMYYVMVKSVLTAVRGALVGWGKLERKATVTSA
jgi:cellulose synthase/poly-beta-1,6-N-acetylglucosamine synthase-like glycosyltransferase/peptidoglycan/xylan/chitin deacetylase (PgdA/CDA1 family)/spore germination protein YaaH